MEYVYAAAILHELNQEINETNMKAVLQAAGADVSESRVKALIAALEGVDLDHVVSAAEPALPEDGDDAATGEIEGAAEGDETQDETDLPETTEEEPTESDSGSSLGNIFGGDDSN